MNQKVTQVSQAQKVGRQPAGKPGIRWRRVAVPLVVLLGMLGASAYSSGVSADTARFTVKDLDGSYAFSAEGTLYPAFPELSPALFTAAMGIFTFDGNGNCTVVDRLNIASLGLVPASGFRTSTSCTYTVNPDGTGTLETSFGGSPGDVNGPGSLTFALVGNGSATEIRFIRSDPGAVAAGVARKQ